MIRSWGYRVRENAGCVALLLILPVLAYSPCLFQDKVPFAPGGLLSLPPWEGASATNVPSDPLSTWQLGTSWPAYQFINENRQDLGALFWNPRVGLGQPFLADVRNRCFSPFTLPFYLFGLRLAWALSLWLKLVVAGWTTFYSARRYGFTAGFALIVALVYQWSGPVFLWAAEPMGDILPWFPLMVLAVDRMLLGQFRAWPKFAVVSALMALGGDVRVFALLLGIVLVYMVLRRVRDRHHVHFAQACGGFVLGLAVAIGLSAPQLLPYITLLREGSTASGTYPWTLTFNTLLGIYGAKFYESVTGNVNPLVDLVNVGRVPVLLIGVWVTIRRFAEKPIRHRVECLGAASLAAAGIPFVAQGLLGHLPLLHLFHPALYLTGLTLPLALMVAALVETWLHLDAEQCKQVLLRMAMVLPLYWGALVVICVKFAWGAGGTPWGSLGVFAGVLLVIAVLFGVTLLNPNPRIMAAGIATTLMLLIAWGRVPRMAQSERASVYPETRLIKALQSVGARVGGTGGIKDWPLNGNQIPALHGRSTMTLHRTAEFLREVDANPLLQRRAGVGSLLLRREDIQGPYATVRADLNILDVFDSGAILFRDLSSAPPYQIVHAVQPADAPDSGPLLPDSLPRVEGFAMPTREGPYEDSINLSGLPTHTQLPLAVSSNQPGILVLSTAWYPRWVARVDGKEASVYAVDGAFLGVEVVAGTHDVLLTFEPRDFQRGLMVCSGSLLVLLAGIYHALRPAKNRL